MASPELCLSDGSGAEELLSQLDDDNLLELNLNSFRHGGEAVAVADQPGFARHGKLESLLLQSHGGGYGDGEVWEKGGVEDDPSKGKPSLRSASAKASPAAVPSKPSSCAPCFCISPMKIFKRGLRRPSAAPNPNGFVAGGGKRGAEDEQSYLEIDFERDSVVRENERDTAPADAKIFNATERETELGRASKEERQLIAEAERLVEWVSSGSARMGIESDDVEMEEEKEARRKKQAILF